MDWAGEARLPASKAFHSRSAALASGFEALISKLESTGFRFRIHWFRAKIVEFQAGIHWIRDPNPVDFVFFPVNLKSESSGFEPGIKRFWPESSGFESGIQWILVPNDEVGKRNPVDSRAERATHSEKPKHLTVPQRHPYTPSRYERYLLETIR